VVRGPKVGITTQGTTDHSTEWRVMPQFCFKFTKWLYNL